MSVECKKSNVRKIHHPNMTDLYIATRSDAPDVLKIGRSNDPSRRCSDLSTSQCFKVTPLAVFPKHGHCERVVHKKLAERRILGGRGKEWFRVSIADACAAISQALDEPKIPHLTPTLHYNSIELLLAGIVYD